jgi:hypothetical protein
MKTEPTTTTPSRNPGHACSDFTPRDEPIGYRVHSSAWPIRVGSLADVVESARSIGAHYEDLSDGGEP